MCDLVRGDVVSRSPCPPTGNIPSTLTTTDLRAIFSCDATLINDAHSGPMTENANCGSISLTP